MKFTGTRGVELQLDHENCKKLTAMMKDVDKKEKDKAKRANFLDSTATDILCNGLIGKLFVAMKEAYVAFKKAKKPDSLPAPTIPDPNPKATAALQAKMKGKKADLERDADQYSRDLEEDDLQLFTDVPAFDIKRTELMWAASKLEAAASNLEADLAF